MLLTNKKEKDEALVYHLNQIDDWVVMGLLVLGAGQDKTE